VTELNPLHVVAAIVIRGNQVLACRRAIHNALAGFWEFPGGKVNPGENSNDALEREINEELGIGCIAIEHFDTSDTTVGEIVIRLETLICQIDNADSMSSTDHDSFVWVGATGAAALDWAPPDIPALSKLIRLGIIK
jgi:8-oxo-dGTP diphosphatase